MCIRLSDRNFGPDIVGEDKKNFKLSDNYKAVNDTLNHFNYALNDDLVPGIEDNHKIAQVLSGKGCNS